MGRISIFSRLNFYSLASGLSCLFVLLFSSSNHFMRITLVDKHPQIARDCNPPAGLSRMLVVVWRMAKMTDSNLKKNKDKSKQTNEQN